MNQESKPTTKPIIANVRITDTMLGFQDHGVLTACLTMEGNRGVGRQIFGNLNCNYRSNALAVFVSRVLNVVDVREWGELKGKTCRVELNPNPNLVACVAIGNIVNEVWVRLDEIIAQSSVIPKEP